VAPMIFINTADFITAEIFTLVHELAHIWIGKSGISSPDETSVRRPLRKGSHAPVRDQDDIESFCNAVAAEILVPKSEFLVAWRPMERKFYDLARHFLVSRLVVLRRAFELDKITSNEFFALLQTFKSERKARTKGGGRTDYIANVATRHSPTVMDSI